MYSCLQLHSCGWVSKYAQQRYYSWHNLSRTQKDRLSPRVTDNSDINMSRLSGYVDWEDDAFRIHEALIVHPNTVRQMYTNME